jgi:hypothetical protein
MNPKLIHQSKHSLLTLEEHKDFGKVVIKSLNNDFPSQEIIKKFLHEYEIVKSFMKRKKVARIQIDPMRETADIDEDNNSWPKALKHSRFEVFKQNENEQVERNPMQRFNNRKK